MKKNIFIIVFLLYILVSNTYSYSAIDYNIDILTKWDELLKKYDNNNLNSYKSFKFNNTYLNNLLYRIYKAEWISENFKILDEYNRIKNIKPIDSSDMTIVGWDNNLSQKKDTSYSSIQSTWFYNRDSAKAYAETWAFNRNSQYNYYVWKWNCTNFVSQVLRAWSLTDLWDYSWSWRSNNNHWNYGNFFVPPTYSWWWAHNLFLHASANSSRFKSVNSFLQLQVWDIVQIDYGKDWTIDHSMVVTNVIWNSNEYIYLTYSSSYDNTSDDRRNKKLSEIVYSYPQSSNNYYAWKVIY